MLRLAVQGITPEIATQLGRRLRGATIVDTALNDRADFDALVVGSAYDPASGGIEKALKSGKPVLVPGDFCTSIELLDAWSQLAAKSKAPFALWNADRFRPSRKLLRTQLDTGKLGVVGLVRIHRWEPTPQSFAPGAWSGKLLCDLDLLLWLAGTTPERVFTTGRPPDAAKHEPDGVGYLQIHCGFADGAMSLLDYSDRLPDGDGYESVSVIASKGAEYADDHQNRQLLFGGGVPRAPLTDEGLKPPALMVQEFVDALEAKRDLSTSIAAWGTALNLYEAAQRSLKSRRAVAWEEV